MTLAIGMTVISSILMVLMPKAGFQGGVISLSVLDLQDQMFDVADEKPWNRIIIHSSMDATGGMKELNQAWNQYYVGEGMPGNRGAGYHFVIDDAHSEHGDGALEMAPRWKQQAYGDFLDGESANQLLQESIGICVMGDVERARFSDKQIEAMTDLIRVLQERYDIPRERVEFRVAQSSDGVAPYFPEAEIRRRIND